MSFATRELIAYLKKHPSELYNIRPRQFEELIAEILVSYGWEVTLTSSTRDGGVDILGVTKTIEGIQNSVIIDCKKYSKDRRVELHWARAIYGVKQDLRVANAMLVTTSDFEPGVYKYKSERYDFDLRNYEGVVEWINEYKPHPNGKLHIKENRLVMPGDEA